MNEDSFFIVFNIDSQLSETGNSGKAVLTLEKMGDFGGSLCQGAKHNGPMGYGFVPGNGNFSF